FERLALAVTEAPEIVPLTATDIALVLSGPLPIQQVQHLWDVPAGECPLALDHLPRVQVAARPELLFDHSVPFFGQCQRVTLCVLCPSALLFLQLAFGFRLYFQGIGLLVQGRLLRLGIAPERDDKNGNTEYRRNADREEGGGRRTASRPLADAFPRTTRPGEDGLATEPAVKGLGPRLRTTIAPLRIFIQALQTDDFEITIRAWVQRSRSLRLLLDDLEQRLHHRFPLERRSSGEALVEDRSQRPHVCRRRQPSTFPGRLFG